jgi:hypothetical protein
VNLKHLASSTSSASPLLEFVADAATDSTFLAAEEILEEGSKVFLICDKGALKVANAHSVKILAWYSRKEGSVKTFMLDSEALDGHINECADAIRHSLSKLFCGNESIVAVLNGQTTDSGGGGVGKSLYENLEEINLCIPSDGYLIGFCTLYYLQLSLANPVLIVLGEGGGQEKQKGILLHCLADDAWSLQFTKSSRALRMEEDLGVGCNLDWQTNFCTYESACSYIDMLVHRSLYSRIGTYCLQFVAA